MLIKTENLVKVFKTEEIKTTAINQVDLNVNDNEFIAIMGPSGCGKSTLLNIVGLLDTPTQGRVYFRDEEVSHYREKKRTRIRRANMGFIFQSFNLIDDLHVFDNIALPLYYMRINGAERKKRVHELMERLHIAHRATHYPQQLSGGQQQRVAIARAVIGNPSVILADEPTGNLDSANGKEVMELLKSLHEEGTTIIIVTHSPRDSKYANRIVQLFDGKIITENILKKL